MTLKRLKVPPYIADAATTWSPAEQILKTEKKDAAFKFGDFCRNDVVCGILEAGVEIARFLKVKEPAHLLARFVFICRALDYRHNARLAVFRSIAGLHALCFYIKAHFVLSFLSVFEKMTHKVEAGINKITGLGC